MIQGEKSLDKELRAQCPTPRAPCGSPALFPPSIPEELPSQITAQRGPRAPTASPGPSLLTTVSLVSSGIPGLGLLTPSSPICPQPHSLPLLGPDFLETKYFWCFYFVHIPVHGHKCNSVVSSKGGCRVSRACIWGDTMCISVCWSMGALSCM